MRVGMLRIELQIPYARSLKEKRRPLRSLLEKVRNRYPVSAAEVDHQDLHQRAAIGIAVAGSDGLQVARTLREVRAFIESDPDCLVLDLQEMIVDGPEPFSGFASFGEIVGEE